jgi:hypothetical protein
MVLCGFARVMHSMQRVRMGAMRMVGRPLMRTGRIVPCGLFMMLRRMLVMLGRFRMMLLRGMFGHAGLPVLTCIFVPAALQSHRYQKRFVSKKCSGQGQPASRKIAGGHVKARVQV